MHKNPDLKKRLYTLSGRQFRHIEYVCRWTPPTFYHKWSMKAPYKYTFIKITNKNRG